MNFFLLYVYRTRAEKQGYLCLKPYLSTVLEISGVKKFTIMLLIRHERVYHSQIDPLRAWSVLNSRFRFPLHRAFRGDPNRGLIVGDRNDVPSQYRPGLNTLRPNTLGLCSSEEGPALGDSFSSAWKQTRCRKWFRHNSLPQWEHLMKA